MRVSEGLGVFRDWVMLCIEQVGIGMGVKVISFSATMRGAGVRSNTNGVERSGIVF